MHLLPNLWLATYFMVFLLCCSRVHKTLPLNLYAFNQTLHCLHDVYILSTWSPFSTKENGCPDIELRDIEKCFPQNLTLKEKFLDELILLFTIILINYMN